MASILIVLPGTSEKSIHLVVEYLIEKGHHVTYVPDELPRVVQSLSAQPFDYTVLFCRQHEKIKAITTHIRNHAPRNLCILVLSMEAFSLAQLIEYHCSGYMLENFCLSDIILCISALNKGDRYISQGVKDMLDEYTGHAAPATASHGLSVRESNILALLAEGKKSRQIADELGISIYTLHNHKTNIRHKLKLQSNRDITFMAIHQARAQKAMRG